MKCATDALACALLLAVTSLARGDEIDTSWIDFEQIEAGEILIQTGETDSPTTTANVALKIEAEPKSIWQILTACEVAPEYVPHVESCEQLETVADGTGELFMQEIKPAFFLPSFEHVFRLDYEPYERIEVSRVSGPLDAMHGSWNLLPQEDGSTLLVHHFAVDPAMPVPHFIVRARLSHDLPEVLATIRERAERLD